MGMIIFWSFLLIIWIIFTIFTIIDDNHSFGEFMFSLIMGMFCGIMIGVGIDKYKTKNIFNSLRCGREYVGTPKDNPFKTDTIKVLNYIEKDNEFWIQYETKNGDIQVSKFKNLIDYFK